MINGQVWNLYPSSPFQLSLITNLFLQIRGLPWLSDATWKCVSLSCPSGWTRNHSADKLEAPAQCALACFFSIKAVFFCKWYNMRITSLHCGSARLTTTGTDWWLKIIEQYSGYYWPVCVRQLSLITVLFLQIRGQLWWSDATWRCASSSSPSEWTRNHSAGRHEASAQCVSACACSDCLSGWSSFCKWCRRTASLQCGSACVVPTGTAWQTICDTLSSLWSDGDQSWGPPQAGGQGLQQLMGHQWFPSCGTPKGVGSFVSPTWLFHTKGRQRACPLLWVTPA